MIKRAKVQFAVSGAGNTTAKLILPKAFVDELEITSVERYVEVYREEDKIIIKKSKKQS